MPKCSKFQFQSKTLNIKLIFLVFLIGLISIQPIVFGDESKMKETQKNLEVGQMIKSDKIIFELEKNEKIHVKHVIKYGEWGDNARKHIEILEGDHSNLKVSDEDGDALMYGISGQTFGESKYIVLQQKLGITDLIAEYDLENFLSLKESLWFKEIEYPFSIEIKITDDVKTIFVNSRPIDISEVDGINCMGCAMTLEFFDDEKVNSQKISVDGTNNVLDILSNGEIKNVKYVDVFEFIEFEITNPNQLVVMNIPFEIILNPFDVFLTDVNDATLDQNEQIRKTEFGQDDDSVNVSFRPNKEGIVTIVSATNDEHESLLSQIEKRTQNVEEKILKNDDQKTIDITDEKGNAEIFEEWKGNNANRTVDTDYGVIYGIIGIVIAVIVIGIIIKFKKN
jgi:hypothetical protein